MKLPEPVDDARVEIVVAERFLAGDSVASLAADYDLSVAQVETILRRRYTGIRRSECGREKEREG